MPSVTNYQKARDAIRRSFKRGQPASKKLQTLNAVELAQKYNCTVEEGRELINVVQNCIVKQRQAA